MANSANPDQLIWFYSVCKGRVYPGSAGQGLIARSLCIQGQGITQLSSAQNVMSKFGLCQIKLGPQMKVSHPGTNLEIRCLAS